MPADRDAVAACQAELLDALLRGGGFPDGFDGRMAAAASLALRRKRARAVARGLPTVARALGTQFEPLFSEHAARHPAPSKPGGLQDGLRFARSVPGETLTDAARTELLLRRAHRRAFLGATRLRAAGRLLVVLRLPLAGMRVSAPRVPAKRSRAAQ